MLVVENTLVSDVIIEKKFVCDLNACRGACCVEGDSGAPVEEEEKEQIVQAYTKAKKYMSAEGVEAVEKDGFFVFDSDKEWSTTLIKKERCAYVYFENNTAKCAFEKAFLNGEISFRKPISCHLYPVRIKKIGDFETVNFHEWEICKKACSCGEKLNISVHRFLKEALIRKFGEKWFNQLELIAEQYQKSKLQ